MTYTHTHTVISYVTDLCLMAREHRMCSLTIECVLLLRQRPVPDGERAVSWATAASCAAAASPGRTPQYLASDICEMMMRFCVIVLVMWFCVRVLDIEVQISILNYKAPGIQNTPLQQKRTHPYNWRWRDYGKRTHSMAREHILWQENTPLQLKMTRLW